MPLEDLKGEKKLLSRIKPNLYSSYIWTISSLLFKNFKLLCPLKMYENEKMFLFGHLQKSFSAALWVKPNFTQACMNKISVEFENHNYSSRIIIVVPLTAGKKWWKYSWWTNKIVLQQCQIKFIQGPSWSWSYDSLIDNYLCNKCLSPLTLWVQIPLRWYNIMW